MRPRPTLDLAALPLHGTTWSSVTWWGTLAFMLIEGTGFALVIAIYFYLANIASEWPIDAPPPDLGPGTALTVVLLASLVPNFLILRWADRGDVSKVRIALLVMTLFGIVPLGLRALEFPALHTRWDSNAYGSITWVLLALHTTHLITDLIDTIVLAAMMFTRHGHNKRRIGDVEDNALYWYFVVAAWLPIYAIVYWGPRL